MSKKKNKNSIVGGYSEAGQEQQLLQSFSTICDLRCCNSTHWLRKTSDKDCCLPASLRNPAAVLTSDCISTRWCNSSTLLDVSNVKPEELLMKKLLFSSADCFLSAYHGHLTSLIDISPYKFRNLEGRKEWVHVVCTSAYNYWLLVN